ncbi:MULTISPECIES: peptidase inhibitor family I36 protein [unclassified Streptomyces]|uniref:peptidase inhibitor family I36 protein n=1 Tax=unclassified Streptomyces TaxID=2593676 RepID=UPI0023665EA7|nr:MULTISPECIES: peptidase inhibitor family I36 protein [unclassified Streptomyces]MDF3142895.1 peptidase inhibitor family I36 protein [Streptomyces sp. T21Q-yed]WDF39296.1 peptidase inhibitor family I36 protein [Streptomyces sp. T12]
MNRPLALTVSALSVMSLCGIGLIGSASKAEAADFRLGFWLYEHDDFEAKDWGMLYPSTRCYNVPASMNNKASSMNNRTDYAVYFYDKKDCKGTAGYAAAPDSVDKDLTNNGFDNKTSSVKVVRVNP